MTMRNFILRGLNGGAALYCEVCDHRAVKALLRFACGIGAVAWLGAAEITLPAETARLTESTLPGYALATTYCYTCHSTDYMQYQPATNTRVAWKASVVKMQKTFGAQIPDSAVDPIAEYLVRTYGAERGGAKTPAPKSGTSGEK